MEMNETTSNDSTFERRTLNGKIVRAAFSLEFDVQSSFAIQNMLSRVANSLYWMARYIERAENIARIVDVNLQLLLDLRNLDEKRLAALLAAHRADHRRRGSSFSSCTRSATGKTVTEFLVFQMENPELHRSSPSARRAKTPAWCATRSRSNCGRN